MRGLLQRYGIPVALYTDRHSVFKNVPGSGLARAPTQFSRAMDELGIQMVFALSPQAKGRVERTAGTFQDRLVTELRLAGATTIEEANVVLKDFLVRFNTRFGVVAQHPEVAYRPLEPDACLDSVLCFRHSRNVARDNTVKYRWRTLQLLPGMERPSYAGTVVEVLEGLDGQLAVRYQGEIIPSHPEAPPPPGRPTFSYFEPPGREPARGRDLRAQLLSRVSRVGRQAPNALPGRRHRLCGFRAERQHEPAESRHRPASDGNGREGQAQVGRITNTRRVAEFRYPPSTPAPPAGGSAPTRRKKPTPAWTG